MRESKSIYIEDGVICDHRVEMQAVGAVLNNPSILNEYIDLIKPKYDFATEELRLLYTALQNAYLNHTAITEVSINIEISKMDKKSQELYYELGNFEVYKKCSKIAQSNTDFKKIYNRLQTFNLIRKLKAEGYDVETNLDILVTKNTDEIIKAFESKLLRATSYIKGINDSIILGEDALEVYEEYKIKPDFGISIPFPIFNSLVRGWRKGKIYADAMHSGHGKSRKALYMIMDIGIIQQTPILMGVNEQDKSEILLMLLTCVSNNIFSEQFGRTIVTETDIALGRCNTKQDEMVKTAAKYIKENSKIHFLELNFWDLDTLKIVLKKHKLRGVDYAVIDTFKPMRNADSFANMAEWQQFVHTVEKLKDIIGSEVKGGLDMALWLTIQMTDDSIEKKSLNSMAIANGKHLKHYVDSLTLSRKLDNADKENYRVSIKMPNNSMSGQIQQLDPDKDYYLTHIEKNRGGLDSKYLIYEFNKGTMEIKEIGTAITAKEEFKDGNNPEAKK